MEGGLQTEGYSSPRRLTLFLKIASMTPLPSDSVVQPMVAAPSADLFDCGGSSVVSVLEPDDSRPFCVGRIRSNLVETTPSETPCPCPINENIVSQRADASMFVGRVAHDATSGKGSTFRFSS